MDILQFSTIKIWSMKTTTLCPTITTFGSEVLISTKNGWRRKILIGRKDKGGTQ